MAQATDAAIKDALVQGKAAELAVQTMINEKLPANSLARDAATGILESAQTGLSLCEQSLNTTKQIADYYKCVNAVRGMASASVGELAAKHWASSGATRLGLFWWSSDVWPDLLGSSNNNKSKNNKSLKKIRELTLDDR